MNVPCHEFREMFDLSLDGGLSRKKRARLREHLKTCPACRVALEAEQEVTQILSDLPQFPCDDGVVSRIEELTIGHRKKSSRITKIFATDISVRWQILSVGFAATAIILLFTLHPILEQKDLETPQFTQEEVVQAKKQAKWSLAYLANKVSETEKEIVENVLLKDLPKMVRKSIKNAVPLLRGGQK